MTYLAINLNDVQEAKPVPHGKYELTISNAQVTQTGENSKVPGSPMLKFFLAFTDLDLNAPTITHFVTIPQDGDENFSFKALMLKRFLVAFGISFGDEGIDLENIAIESQGQTATLEVNLSEPDANGNVYNRVVLPRLPSEDAPAAQTKRRR